MILAPSILSASLTNLKEDIDSILPFTRHIHIDVMDGHFVPKITFGDNIVKAVRSISPDIFIDAHLMVSDPESQIEYFASAGANLITIHQESTPHLHKLVHIIKSLGLKAGVSLNPATPDSTLDYVLDELDLILVMSVNPGLGGQEFIPSQLQKIKSLRSKFAGLIQVDGGINLTTMKQCLNAGADAFVCGNYIFGVSGSDRERRIREMLDL